MRYNPDKAPSPRKWLNLDESERINLVQEYHDEEGIELPNAMLHSSVHAIVENQIAQAYGPTVRAMARLQTEGLSRHDAVHAIGTVVAEIFFEAGDMESSDIDPDKPLEPIYEARVEALSAEKWLREYGEQ